MASNVERIMSLAKSDVRLQTIVNNYFLRIGHPQHFVGGLSFKENKDDSPAFCLGFQTFSIPIGFIFVSEGLLGVLTQEELEFVVLHEIGHITKNHVVGSSFVWLMKSWIIDMIADMFEVSKQKAKQYLELLKAFYVLISQKKTPEEEAKARYELEADNFAYVLQGRKDPAISTLLKLSQGNIRAPTHVTFDGSFPFPIVTYEERIEAIRRDC
ncbi:M48 family metalloprotease [Candidatus Bathyarchaeota archaeon]|nr:M48 family metalloprotease [Candidatus Bathyarchaeota archaeon]